MDNKDKYRLWDEENKQMHYDDFVITSTGFAAKITEVAQNIFQFDQTDLEFDKKNKKMKGTGKHSANDKLVYEDDLLISNHLEDDEKILYRVVWNNDDAKFELHYLECREDNLWTDSCEDFSLVSELELIGNIYENKELLK